MLFKFTPEPALVSESVRSVACGRGRTLPLRPSSRDLRLGRAAVLTKVKLNDGRQEVVAIQVHYLVPGGDEILDELLVRIGTGVNLCRGA